jgi:hypothetical protein
MVQGRAGRGDRSGSHQRSGQVISTVVMSRDVLQTGQKRPDGTGALRRSDSYVSHSQVI